MNDQQKQEANRRAVWTGENPVEIVDGVPFVNIGGEGSPKCVSAPITEERLTRWRSLGYREFDGDVAEVDRLLAEQRQQILEQEDHRQFTIESLEDSNRRLSEDLFAERRKNRQLVEADQTGAAQKISDLAGELDRAARRIAELEQGSGEATGTTDELSALQKEFDEFKERVSATNDDLLQRMSQLVNELDRTRAALEAEQALVAELKKIPADQAVIEEIMRIAGLDKGFKKELEALAERLTAPAAPADGQQN